MNLRDVNPHIRFAAKIHYISSGNSIKVADCRLIYTTAGSAKLRIANHIYPLMPNSLFYCSAGSEYTIEAPEGFDPICLNFDMTQARSEVLMPLPPVALGTSADFEEIQDSEILNGHLYFDNAEDLLPAVQKIVELYAQQLPHFREHGSCSLKKLLLLLHRDPKTAMPSKIALVKNYIDQHYSEDITNTLLAGLVGYHEYYLNRLFTACTGSSLHEYLLKVRLNRASFLMLNTEMPLKAIPEQVGFHSYPHFSNYFKQYFGLSPAEYRKNLKSSI